MIPVDILDHIFSYLDLQSLEAVSSTNSFFSSVAERHRYADIILTSESNDNNSEIAFTPTTLLHLLEKRPHIANYILHLTICMSAHRLNLPAILDLLQNLRNLTIEQRLFVDIRWSRRFADILNPLPFLRDLWLPDADFYDRHHAPLLWRLSIDSFPYSILKLFTPWIAKFSNNLRYFKASLIFGDGDNDNDSLCTIAPILFSCSNTLTSLIFHLTYECLPPGDIPLGSEILNLPHLEEASFYMRMGIDGCATVIIPFVVITQLLRTAPKLQRLSLCFVPYSGWGFFFSLEQFDWSDVDTFLETRSRSEGFIVDLSISTKGLRLRPQQPDYDTKSSLAKYPNMKRMIEQSSLIISEATI